MHKFLIHDKEDHVGVAVEDIKAGEKVVGVIMEDGSSIEVVSNGDVPLGHKIATKNVNSNAQVLKYGIQIGYASEEFKVGDYVHTHNLKTARW